MLGGKKIWFSAEEYLVQTKDMPPPPFQPAGFTFYFHVHLCTCVPPSIKIQACQYISPSRTCDLHAVGFLFSTRCEFADNFHPGQCLRKWSSYCFDNGAEREALVYLWYTWTHSSMMRYTVIVQHHRLITLHLYLKRKLPRNQTCKYM